MPPFVQFVIRRLLAIPITLLIITMVLYGTVMLVPVETRAMLYWPPNASTASTAASSNVIQELNERVIAQYGLDDPFLVQYTRWIAKLIRGDWGMSPGYLDVLEALWTHIPATIELTLYTVLVLVSTGIISGVTAGWRENRPVDHTFRAVAFVSTSLPPFILALILLAIFYATLNWFPPGRYNNDTRFLISGTGSDFANYTGLLTVDGILNGHPEVSWDAFRHLVLPVFTLSLAHWATVGRVTRAAMIEELRQPYITAALGRGLSMREAVWRHALRNALLPGLNSSAVSAATLVTGVFVVEAVFDYPGISQLMVHAISQLDLSLSLGSAIFSLVVVLPLMFVLDILQATVDPRLREGVMNG